MIYNIVLRQLAKGEFTKNLLHRALLFKGAEAQELFFLAREKRKEFFSDEKAEVRSVVEISNICRRKCNFCNINLHAKTRKRYLLGYRELMVIVEHIYTKAGESFCFNPEKTPLKSI